MVESRPVATCVALSSASACNAENVFPRKAGTVQDRAPPRTVWRRNSRRVWRVISFFMGQRVEPRMNPDGHGWKHQAPSSKLQRSSNAQAPKVARGGCLELGARS